MNTKTEKETKVINMNGNGGLDPIVQRVNAQEIGPLTLVDVENLKVVFEWALSVSVRDRDRLAQILTFEKDFILRLNDTITKQLQTKTNI